MKSNVFNVTRPWQLSFLDGRHFSDPGITDEEFDYVLRVADALWLHNGDPKMPHAELTSGKCSNGFVDVLRVLKYVNLCELFGHELHKLLTREKSLHSLSIRERRPDWVIGSDHAGATISYEVARRIGAKHDFTEKDGKTQLWKRHVIKPDELVLQVEELVTTTGTLRAVREGIQNGNSNPVTFVPVVMTLVHRSDTYEFEGSPILYFRHYEIESWEPGECPLCAAGSKRLRPKQSWAELTGKEE